MKELEELKKNEEDLSKTTTKTTQVTQNNDLMTQLRVSAKSEATLIENRQKMLKKDIYDIAEKIFKDNRGISSYELSICGLVKLF